MSVCLRSVRATRLPPRALRPGPASQLAVAIAEFAEAVRPDQTGQEESSRDPGPAGTHCRGAAPASARGSPDHLWWCDCAQRRDCPCPDELPEPSEALRRTGWGPLLSARDRHAGSLRPGQDKGICATLDFRTRRSECSSGRDLTHGSLGRPISRRGTGAGEGARGRSGVPVPPRGGVTTDAGVRSFGDVYPEIEHRVPQVPPRDKGGGPRTHVELLPEPLAVVCGPCPDLLLQVAHRDGEVLLGPGGGPAEKHHSLLLCGVTRNRGIQPHSRTGNAPREMAAGGGHIPPRACAWGRGRGPRSWAAEGKGLRYTHIVREG